MTNRASFVYSKRQLLTSRQAGEIKPVMIKGPFSKSLAALHSRALWSRLNDWKLGRSNWRGEGRPGSTASEIRCALDSLSRVELNSFYPHPPPSKTQQTQSAMVLWSTKKNIVKAFLVKSFNSNTRTSIHSLFICFSDITPLLFGSDRRFKLIQQFWICSSWGFRLGEKNHRAPGAK